ncbi:MAG: hypothetical protein ACOYT8_04190 [Candidatus Dependentiae bacterium]
MNYKLLLLTCCLANGVALAKYCPAAPQKQMVKKSSMPAPKAAPQKQVVKKAPMPATTKPAPQPTTMPAFDYDREWENMAAQIKKIDPNIPADVLEGMKKDFRAQVESEMNKHINR